ncbi:putative membrane protein [Emiliania huxleyi virus 164]|nr:putative membrane protein [Emiliania huxleyi virus 164]
MKGKCQTFTAPGKYNVHHPKIAGNPRECETTPLAGRTVALYSDHWKRFVKIDGRRVIMSPTINVPSVPAWWHSEKFELVSAQDGQFALYNHKYKNYLRMPGRNKDMDGSDRQNKHSSIPHNQMGWERFQFIHKGDGQYAIKCPYSVGGPSYMRAGGHHVNGVPHSGPWEQFRLIDVHCRVGFNDSFSSALVYPGYAVGLYEHNKFDGKKLWIDPGQHNELGDHGDRASSIIVRRDTW